MGNVFVHTMMSLDGFIAGPNDDMSWVFRHAGDMPGAVVDEVIARTGAVLAGRRVYEVAGGCSDPRSAGCSTDAGAVRISSLPTRHRPTRPTRPTSSFPGMSGTRWRPR
jgi:hypothetical protein